MKDRTRQIIVISAMIMRTAMYVTVARKRADGKYQVELSNNLREAKEFDTPQEANAVKENISNPFERKYVVEETLVEWSMTKTDLVPGNFK
jgi:hypothetical protein